MCSRSFFRLSEALIAKNSSQGSILSWEVGLNGKRKFLLTPSMEQFWEKYVTLSLEEKKYYEVIEDNSPSKLYFDVEYKVNQNPHKDGGEMSIRLIQTTNDLLNEMFDHKVAVDDILVLEASTPVKFSQHIIYTKTKFENNRMVGEFVKVVKKRLCEKFTGQFEVVHNGRVVNFVDINVYKKNQQFRMFLSRKLGKMNPLVLSSSLNSTWKCDSLENKRTIFMASLVTRMEDSSSLLQMQDSRQIASDCVSSSSVIALEKSPYKEVEDMLTEIVRPGYIRDCVFYPSRIVFNIGGSRFCQNVNRQHTSNHIYFICDLKELTLVQGCHSCKGFRGPPIIIPEEKVSWLDEFRLDNEF